MAVKFIDFAKQCKFRVHQDDKCINPEMRKNLYRLVGSCQYNFCPLKQEFQRLQAGGSGPETENQKSTVGAVQTNENLQKRENEKTEQ